MKNKRVQCLLLLSTAMLLASCGGATSSSSSAATSQPEASSSAQAGDTNAPIISGVKAKLTCQAGESLDLLEGVTAVDDVDGNLTSQIAVSIAPERPIVNGVVQFSKDDEGFYDVTYEVRDAAGNVTNEYSEVTVTEALGEKTLVKEFAFARDLEGWAPEIVEGTAVVGTHGISHGKYVYDITESDGVDWHIKHAYYNYPVQAGHSYEITAKFHSTVAGIVRFNGVDKEIRVGNNEIKVGMNASLDGGRNIELQFGLLQGPFVVSIESIRIDDVEKAIDEDATEDLGFDQEEVLTSEWAFDKDDWHCEYSADAGMGTIEKTPTSATVTSTSPEPRESWRGKFIIQTKNVLKAGKKYHYSVTYTASADISGLEFGCGFWADDFKAYDERYGIALEANTPRTFEFDVTPAEDLDNPFVVLKMGNTPGGVSITASDFSITSPAVIDFTQEGNAAAWAENAGKNELLNCAKNSVTAKVTGDAEDPYKASTDLKMPNATLVGGKSYRLSFDLTANNKVEKVNAMMGELEAWDPEQLFATGESITLEAGETQTIKAIITPAQDIAGLKMRVKYGAAENGTEITVANLHFEGIEFVKADAESILPENWGFNYDDYTAYGQGDHAPTVVATADEAVFTATQAGNLWEAKAIVESRTELKKGSKYHIALDVVASAEITGVEFGAGYLDGDFKQIDHTYGKTLHAGQLTKIEYTTASLDSNFADNWGIAVFIGEAVAGTTLTVSNLVVEELPNASNVETKEFTFLPEGISVYANEDAGARADLYVENGELVYDIIALSHDSDWYNKLTISDIVLDGGAKYIFEMVVKASVPLNASLILNKMGAWDPRATQAIEFGTEYSTVTLETDVMTAPLKFELLFQDLHQNEDVNSAKITFQSIKLFSQAVAE